MRIFDELDNLLETFDETKGYLKNDSLFVRHHEAISAVEEQGHWETLAEYPNGGKDVDWVIDVPAVEAKEAWDEYEDILRFVPFSVEELAERRVADLKGKLFDTDYKILKIVEGASTISEMADVIKQRAAWRKEINELERDIAND
jgi:hypothetical protein